MRSRSPPDGPVYWPGSCCSLAGAPHAGWQGWTGPAGMVNSSACQHHCCLAAASKLQPVSSIWLCTLLPCTVVAYLWLQCWRKLGECSAEPPAWPIATGLCQRTFRATSCCPDTPDPKCPCSACSTCCRSSEESNTTKRDTYSTDAAAATGASRAPLHVLARLSSELQR